MVKKIAVVTGNRAEYGILKPVMEAIKSRKSLQLQVVVAGSHLADAYGHTIDEINQDGFHVDCTASMLSPSDKEWSMSQSIGVGILRMSEAWEILNPDIVLILGDRIEALCAAISGAYSGKIVAHIHGGDTSGGLDEQSRYAITKFSHIHFPATNRSADNIKKLGEDEWRIHIVGSPAIDGIVNEKLYSQTEIASRLCLDVSRPIVVLVQHPVTTELYDTQRQIVETLESLDGKRYNIVALYPNSDSGSRVIIDELERYRKILPMIVIKSLPRKEYLSLLKASSVLVGNSSSGLIDAPSLGLRVINIGSRQNGRERSDNVIDVDYNRWQIGCALHSILYSHKLDNKFVNVYGDGKSSQRIADILDGLEINQRLFNKSKC